MRESKIEKKVCEYAEGLGFLAYKFTSPGRSNVPDQALIDTIGRTFFIEFKATGEQPRPGQVREIERMRKQGCVVFVVDNIDYGKGVINGIVDDIRLSSVST